MKIYLDSSSLFRLYHHEPGTSEFLLFLSNLAVTGIFLSYISKLEFESTIWKKVRTKEIKDETATELIRIFRDDYTKFEWIEHSLKTEEIAINCLDTYGAQGLRTLDSIHFASALLISHQADLFLTEDKLLKKLWEKAGMKTEV
jgi:uncharacterized protein